MVMLMLIERQNTTKHHNSSSVRRYHLVVSIGDLISTITVAIAITIATTSEFVVVHVEWMTAGIPS